MTRAEPHEQVVRALEAAGVPFVVRRHADHAAEIRAPADFAAALGYAPERIAKALLVRCRGPGDVFALVVVPAPARVDLAAVAGWMGCPRVELAGKQELAERLGYPPTGVSPLGARGVPVLMDRGLLEFPTVLVGGGAVGVEIELAPRHLREAAEAEVMVLVMGS